MPFDREQLRLLDATEEVEIETTGVDGTVHRTVIWVVVAGDRPFIRSYRGPNARWYREAGRDPNVTLLVDGRRIPARVVHDDDAVTIGRVSDELQRKYPADPATPDMIRPEVLGTTLRVESV